MIRNVIFWLDKYPRSIAGTIKALSSRFNVICVCLRREIDEERAKMGWGYDEIAHCKFHFLSEEAHPIDVVTDIANLNADESFHFMLGLRNGGINKYVYKYIMPKHRNIAVIAERPTAYQLSFAKRLLSQLYYRFMALILRNRIKCILAMGMLGVKAYRAVGWPQKMVLPYLYHKITKPVVNEQQIDCKNIKFVYVGQFSKRKGVDLIMEVFDSLNCYNWTLDVVGANGDMEKEVIEWCNENPKVNDLGVWNSMDVSQNIGRYDLCLVPSRYDGWGMVVMEAVEAGVGCITTTDTGSRDLIDASGAGVVIPSNSIEELVKYIRVLLKYPQLLDEWKSQACKYKNNITDERIAEYVTECILYFSSNSDKYPHCPWL